MGLFRQVTLKRFMTTSCEGMMDGFGIYRIMGCYHTRKTIRVVFDCAATYRGTSLNKELLQGPDLTNTLLGVFLRFCQEPIAMMADIDRMFHQVRVPPEDVDFLRFLW